MKSKTAIPCVLCLFPGHAARLILVPGEGATAAEKAFIARLDIRVDRVFAAKAIIEKLGLIAEEEANEVRH